MAYGHDHQMSFLGEDNGSSHQTMTSLSQHSSINKDNSYLQYNSVPLSDDKSHLPPNYLRPPRKISIFGWWKYELLASAISIGTIMALALVVRRYEGRPIQDINLPQSLQLSALVAALSTVMRVSLLVPVASAMSQDSWLWFSNPGQQNGKVCRSRLKDLDLTDNASRGPWGSLLFLLKGRGRWFAYIGALVTILSLGIPVFTQQLVVYKVLLMNHGVPALSNIPRSQSWSSNEGIMDAVTRYVNPRIKAAVQNGFFTPDVQPPSLTCVTGNCTWPTTPTLGVCGECSKNDFKQTCNATVYGGTECNFTVPSGTSFKNGTGLFFKSTPGAGSKYNSTDPTRAYLANWDVGGVNYSYGWTGWNKTTFVTYECALWACVQSYEASVQASTQTQVKNQEWSSVVGIQNDTNSYKRNMTFGNPMNASTPGLGEYTITNIAGLMLSEYLTQWFNGTVYAPGSRGIAYSNDYVEVIYNATTYSDLDGLTKNIALSMSNVFRTAEPAQHDVYNGIASTLSVAVKWEWLTLPIILIAASLLLSLINIIRTARSEVGAWKGGPLALLVTDLDPTARKIAMANMDVPGGLVRSVGDMKAVLSRNRRGGWSFEAA